MSTLSIFVFDNADNFVIRRDLTSSELAAKSATFSLPKSLASTPCSFYAIANYDASSAKTRAALTALVEKSAADYNGTFVEVSTAAKRSGGFVMSGMKSQTVGAMNSTTNVGITLKRYLVRRYGKSIDTMLSVQWVAEDWNCCRNANTPKPCTFSMTTTTSIRSWRICRWITTSGRWSCWQRCPRMP